MKTTTAHRIIAWTLLAAAFVLYIMTVSPTIAFWDSGEFVTCARILGIPHPPGSPLLSLVGRVASLLPLRDFRGMGIDPVGFRINLINVVSGALTVMLLYLIAVKLIGRVRPQTGELSRDWPTLFGAALAAIVAGMSHQFWENAVETETYMSSILLSMTALWLVLRWEEKKDDPGAVRLLFLASYLVGLGNGIHLYVLLIVPSAAFIVLTAKSEWFTDSRFIMGLVATAAGFAVIRIGGGKGGFYLAAIALAVAAPLILWRLGHDARVPWKSTLTGVLVCASLYVAGYSVYPTIIIRAAKNPVVNEGDPSNWERFRDYVERKQYGQGNMYAAMFERKANFRYQFGFMYLRYLLLQFPKWGPSPEVTFTNDRSADYPGRPVQVSETTHVSLFFWALVLLGLAVHARRDVRRFSAVLLYFLATSAGLVLYLNMANPEARERDYFFLGSFYILTVWIGFGAYTVLHFIRERLERSGGAKTALPASIATACLLATIVPSSVLSNHINPDYSNYQAHDRSKNIIPLEYGINILDSCERDAFLFTHGDNDTYPVWYASFVLGMRPDVRVINLSLLNAPWYIKQLRDDEPKVPINLDDAFIDERLTGESLSSLEILRWSPEPRRVTMSGLTWDMPPSVVFPTGRGEPAAYLSASSYLTARIIRENDWRQPIHFAVTVAPQTLIGLENYMKTQGMVFLLTRERHEGGYGFDIPALERNLFGKFLYTGVTDPAVYKDYETSKLLMNYFVSYVDLCRAYLETGDRDNAARTARAAIELTLSDLDRRIILYRILDRNGLSGEAARMVDEELARYSMDDAEHMIEIGTKFIEYEMSSGAVTLFTRLTARHPQNLLAWKALSASYYQSGHVDEAGRALNRVLELAPRDREALELRRILDENTGNR